ncbi:ferredoxin--NADP reductase [Alphaproteobacteria bacterium]|nr:ferredoxin--NADP reductase [Alphaproteobacteria bacterium]
MNLDNLNLFDVAIIGAGVAGLYAVYCCGVAGLDVCIIEALGRVGGQCKALYPEKKVYGVPGFIDETACAFIEKLTVQCLAYAKEKLFSQKVTMVSKTDDFFKIETSKTTVFAKHIIIASGIGEMTPNAPNIKGLTETNSEFVQYYCMKTDLYKGKLVIVAGGGDSAVDLAINISSFAKKIFLIHRREALACEPCKLKDLEHLASHGKLEIILDTLIEEVDSARKIVKTNKREFSVDYIVFCYGFRANGSLIQGLENLGVEFENNLIKIDINTLMTTTKNCYAIGDAVTYENKKKNIVSCFFEADRAARHIVKWRKR